MQKIIPCTLILCSLAFITSATSAEAAVSSKTSPPPLEKTYIDKTAAEKRIREYFKDLPVMIEIARCESNFRQYTDAGNPLRGGSSGGMVGVFQFFESIHSSGALALGYDITTLEGNLAYARHVYNSQGTTPWDPAKDCWDVKPLASAVVATKDPAALRAQIKQLTTLIAQLQKRLEAQKEINRQRRV